MRRIPKFISKAETKQNCAIQNPAEYRKIKSFHSGQAISILFYCSVATIASTIAKTQEQLINITGQL